MSQQSSADQLFAQLKETPKKLVIDDVTYYILEGDLILDETELLAYATRRVAIAQKRDKGLDVRKEPLLGIVDDEGRIVRWQKGLVLTYAIRKASFANQKQYEIVARAMRQATSAWEAVCGVNFNHLSHLDDSSPEGAERPIFHVARRDSMGKYVAIAFFPYHPASRRSIFIDPTFFSSTLPFAPVGILRHELGHVLGFRHEHIRSGAPPECPDENPDHIIELSLYDPQSVMHYFCGDIGTRKLFITDFDRQGARQVYGPPDRELAYFE